MNKLCFFLAIVLVGCTSNSTEDDLLIKEEGVFKERSLEKEKSCPNFALLSQEVKVCLPQIAGFTECFKNDVVNEMVKRFETVSLKTLGYYLTKEGLENFQTSKEEFRLSSWIKVEIHNQMENKSFTPSEWNDFKKELKSQISDDASSKEEKAFRKVMGRSKSEEFEHLKEGDFYSTTLFLAPSPESTDAKKIIGFQNYIYIAQRVIIVTYYNNPNITNDDKTFAEAINQNIVDGFIRENF